MKMINTVGVVGAGTMGAALAQKFAQQGFTVILADRADKYLEKGLNGIKDTLNQGVERRIFKPEQVEAILGRITGTSQNAALKDCDLVIEAIYENFEAKSELFKELGSILSPEAILATNTSSFSVSELAAFYPRPAQFVGMHYFFHAAKNRLVEIIPGEKTAPEVIKIMELFSFLSGKDPIACKDAYGFVVNRFFVPWLNESARLLGEGLGSMLQIDQVCRKAFGIGMGPFALMNATGVPVAYHSQKTLEIYGPLYKASETLGAQTDLGQEWDLSGETEAIDSDLENKIRDRMLGIVFYVCSELLESGVCAPVDINRGARIGLRWKRGPIEMMQRMGASEVKRLIDQIAAYYGVNAPAKIEMDSWKVDNIDYQVNGSVALLKFSRPEDLNALNEHTMQELDAKMDLALNDSKVESIVLTGSGKAFVAGADIGFFLKNMRDKKIDNIVGFTEFGQSVFEKIDASPKKVVAILNGLTLGGGLELALCADMILALPQAIMAFPETGIGIYPGLGGTQRTPGRVGKGLAKYLVFTGQMLPASKACEIGLIDGVIKAEEMFSIMQGKSPLPNPGVRPEISGTPWQVLDDLFDKYSLDQIMDGSLDSVDFPGKEKLVGKLKRKAPISLKISEKLINEAKGVPSELLNLSEIFSTEDAMLGLSGIGKRVTFIGK